MRKPDRTRARMRALRTLANDVYTSASRMSANVTTHRGAVAMRNVPLRRDAVVKSVISKGHSRAWDGQVLQL